MAKITEVAAIALRDFLEGTPPGTMANIRDLGGDHTNPLSGRVAAHVNFPEITLFCDTPVTCSGNRVFKTSSDVELGMQEVKQLFLTYVCKNCSKSHKTFALWIMMGRDLKSGQTIKYGEKPDFGPPTPARVISLIGPQKELYLKGRRAENQGMGIAAFAYYRRVIEDQKDRMFDEIIRVCERLSSGHEIIDELKAAKGETQFGKAVGTVKHALPPALFINGHNPLTLLHSALSEGLHAQTDEECLEIAKSVRVVMADFAERMGQAMQDDAELNTAVSRLLQRKSKQNGS